MMDVRYTRDVLDLDRVRAVLGALGNPDGKYPILHVAGTKGKGSVCALAASILQTTGQQVGLFSKPHLIRLNERISISGFDIPDEQFVDMMNLLHPHLERQRVAGNPLTFFDLIAVLALVYFAEMKVDVVVLEVGLGGRLDSTNVVHPEVSVITSIDYDHTHILGDTLEKIAKEKAGIIKRGIPVISGVTDPGPAGVIQEIAEAKDAPLLLIERNFTLAQDNEKFSVETWRRRFDNLKLPLLGAHQRRNAAVAIATVESLSETLKLAISEEQIRRGLANVRLRGRIEVISHKPTVILDVAHNPVSLRALRETLERHYSGKCVVLLLGMSHDKDVKASLSEILPVAATAVFTGIGHPRGVDPEELCQLAKEFSPRFPCEAEPDIEKALQRALQLTEFDEILCITGSFYLAGVVAAKWQMLDDTHH
ncbi:MAG: hypothetical protein A2Z21_02765 [Candidatus Fraserbacteria bacterium RBG_16_55_9]|uniref:tetrahydrofolate synthase n=1 Tax=Fraserbacteria sp. (strain RBG_16_55_9) TaxID=1817864 RepID=A0A1F5V2K9_FRAXR|nr:MAG: hypothetical protein A2Z21_02765 [Candidatus Fraserbacteria bacterium RBG_16_55_9]